MPQPGDALEMEVDGSIIDLVRPPHLIEIQTRNFSALKPKLKKFLDDRPMRIVHPISQNRWIVKIEEDRVLSRRKSPKHGTVYDVFKELVYIHPFLLHPNLTIEVLVIEDEEIREHDGKGSWRRKGWSIIDRHLLTVVEHHVLNDLLALIPSDLDSKFTTADLAKAAGIPRRTAQQMAYCLKHIGLIETVGKQGRSFLYYLTS